MVAPTVIKLIFRTGGHCPSVKIFWGGDIGIARYTILSKVKKLQHFLCEFFGKGGKAVKVHRLYIIAFQLIVNPLCTV